MTTKGTSLVEMLAVMSVIMILLGAFTASAVRSKSASNEAAIRVQASMLENVLHRALLKSNAENNAWRTAHGTITEDAAHDGFANGTKAAQLFDSKILAYMDDLDMKEVNRSGVNGTDLIAVFKGYHVIFPLDLAGSVTVKRLSDNQTIYP